MDLRRHRRHDRPASSRAQVVKLGILLAAVLALIAWLRLSHRGDADRSEAADSAPASAAGPGRNAPP